MKHRKAYTKETGKTDSERYLEGLAERSFLKLWSYPSPYYDKKLNSAGDGKELCDLLVVFGDTVLIFSDKEIGWSDNEDVRTSWRRWYRKAIKKSVDQLLGAKRWVSDFQGRIFLDKSCEQPFPVGSLAGEKLTFHLVAVASGSENANRSFFRDGDGALIQDSSLRGGSHTAENCDVFSVGDVAPESQFIHVLDRVSLTVAMNEFDTITDFIDYLGKREAAFRGPATFTASGEPELIGYFLQNHDEVGARRFDGFEGREADEILIPEGVYSSLVASDAYRRKREANSVSYFWDGLINIFAQNLLDGEITNSAHAGDYFDFTEAPLRIMAAEDRTSRRGLGKAFSDFYVDSESRSETQMFRTVMSRDMERGRRIIYVIFILVFSDEDFKGGYDSYRQRRQNMLALYCQGILNRNRQADAVIGIAVDAPPSRTGREGGSEDLIFVEQGNLDESGRMDVDELLAKVNLLKNENLSRRNHNYDEFPPEKPLSRQQRRARERREKKSNRHT